MAGANIATMKGVQGLLTTHLYSLESAELVANALKNVQTIVDGVNLATETASPAIARDSLTIEELFATTQLSTEQATLGYTVPLYSLPAPPSPATPTPSLNPNFKGREELLAELGECYSALDSLTEKYRELVAEKITADLLIQNLRANLD